MKELELMLLKVWKENGVKEIYKYKSRIKFFREPLPNIELFFDMGQKMFRDVEDIANTDALPEEFKRNIDDLIQLRS